MGGVAFVFSGQGDQYPGMGKELCERYPAAAKVFAICDAIRPGTAEQCFSGTAEELKETVNTQPCLYAMELAAARVLLGKIQVPWQIALPFAVAAAFLWGAGVAFRRGMRRYLTHSCNRYRDMGFRN